MLALPDLPADLAPFIDHTLLRPDASEREIDLLCQEAVRYRFFAVCVNGAHVQLASRRLADTGVLVAAVVGFPLGASASRVKAQEAAVAVDQGARELDMVVRIDLIKQGEHARAGSDIAAVVAAGAGARVKVILESTLLSREEIVLACSVAEQAGAHFVKTSTGFVAKGHATLEHVALMRASVSDALGVKASGGVRTFEQARALLAAGATRLGTSAGVALVTGQSSQAAY
jgi:deoxyribose-phosphate aldolase